MGSVAFRVLGPVEVIRDGQVVPLGQGKATDLLAALIMSPGQAGTTEAIIATVWPDRPPEHPRATLHSAVKRLRHAIGGDFIETLPSGYRFRAAGDSVDLRRFERLRAEASQPQEAEKALALLSEAVGLWRGVPLENVVSPVLLSDMVPRLTDAYLGTCEEWARLSLEDGQYEAVVTRLGTLAEAHPFRERLIEQLMLALYLGGRQADALAAYEAVRRALRDELGIDPSRALSGLHLKILRADPSLSSVPRQAGHGRGTETRPTGNAGAGSSPAEIAVPRQLPRDLPDFCGREEELAGLAAALTGSDSVPGRTPVAVISGKGGVGKTALAIQAAHALSAAFPDGQLLANLYAHGPKLVPAASVLSSFLRALGVAGAAIPQRMDDRVALFRSLTAGRRMLIVLDNAASEIQVGPLLPASSSCAVIVTSRARMTGLAGALRVNLDVLDDGQAMGLLAAIVGRKRVTAELVHAWRLVSLCGGLPLALRIVGTRLASKAHWPLATLTGLLADERHRLNELTSGDLDVRATFAVSYRALDRPAMMMLRRLSLLDAPDFPAWSGAALLDIDPDEAADICERLVDAQLLDPVTSRPPGEIRYQFHDLVRAFARELATEAEPEPVRAAALDRAFGAWLALAQQAHSSVYGGDYTILHAGAPRWTRGNAALREDIERNPVDWLETERLAILAAVRQSAELGRHEASWDLTWTAVTLWEARGYYGDWTEAAERALVAARSAGDARGIAAMLCCLASVSLQTGPVDSETRARAEEALRLFGQAGDVHGSSLARYRVGLTYARTGDLERAIAELDQSRDDARAAEDSFMEAGVLRELGSAHLRRGGFDAADACLVESLRLHEQTGSLRGQALTLYTMGELNLRQGDPHAAAEIFRQVLGMIRPGNDAVGRAYVTLGLGEALAAAGNRGQAEEHLLAALRMGRAVQNYTAESRALQALERLNRLAACR